MTKFFLLFLLLSGFQFMNAQPFFYSVQIGSRDQAKYELYSHQGKKLTTTTYDWLESNDWGWIFAWNGKMITVLDSTGKILLDKIEEVHHILSGTDYIPLKKDGHWGYYNNQGTLVLPHTFDDVTLFREGKAAVIVDSVYYYIDITGKKLKEKFVPNNDFDFIVLFSPPALTDFMNSPQETFTKKGKTGLKDAETKRVLIEAQYDGLYSLSSQNVVARLKKKFGVVNFEGKVLIPIEYEMVYLLDNNR